MTTQLNHADHPAGTRAIMYEFPHFSRQEIAVREWSPAGKWVRLAWPNNAESWYKVDDWRVEEVLPSRAPLSCGSAPVADTEEGSDDDPCEGGQCMHGMDADGGEHVTHCDKHAAPPPARPFPTEEECERVYEHMMFASDNGLVLSPLGRMAVRAVRSLCLAALPAQATSIAGIRLVSDPSVPPGELHAVHPDGRVDKMKMPTTSGTESDPLAQFGIPKEILDAPPRNATATEIARDVAALQGAVQRALNVTPSRQAAPVVGSSHFEPLAVDDPSIARRYKSDQNYFGGPAAAPEPERERRCTHGTLGSHRCRECEAEGFDDPAVVAQALREAAFIPPNESEMHAAFNLYDRYAAERADNGDGHYMSKRNVFAAGWHARESASPLPQSPHSVEPPNAH